LAGGEIVITDNSYEIETDSINNEYSEEVMYTGWNPIVALSCQHHLASHNNQKALANDPAITDAEQFMKKMYISQR
jgi:hypothetical protein